MMYLSDYHVHSTCSPDGSLTMAQMAQAAAERGLDELCFTDHVDTIYWDSGKPRDSFPWDRAAAQFAEAQRLWGDRVQLRLGAELGEAYMDFALAEKLLADAPPLDFIIGSVHMAGAKFHHFDLYDMPQGDDATHLAIMEDYLTQVQTLVDWGKFDVLGHLTLPLRYINERYHKHLTFDRFGDKMDTILRTIIRKGLGIECNTNRGNPPLPYEKLLRRYRELGGEIITLGSDAHSAEFVGCAMAECQALLRRCGFRCYTTFEKRRPVERPL